METRHYWEENGHAVKYDNYNSNDGFRRAGDSAQLNFAAASEDEAEYPGAYIKKGKVTRQDPMSHRIIEKRRRDRMNNCLADLSRLIPPEYLKKGRGRVEKTEIIEMAIRHLKYLQDRANVAERQMGEDFRAGFQEAVAEAVRFLVEVQGYSHGDGICVQLAAHLQRHCDNVTKGHPRDTKPRHASRSHPGSSSETTSSSSSCQGYAVKPMITTTAPSGPPPFPAGAYEPERPSDLPYMMECDRVLMGQISLGTEGDSLPESEPLPLDGRRQREQNLRAVRKDHTEDYLHSYKFKNSIERRFSKSQDTEAAQAMAPHGAGAAGGGKAHAHKRRRAHKPAPSTSASGSTEETRDTSPQDTSSESPHQHYDKLSSQYVPVFALNSLGKYYVPLSVSYACLSRHLGSFDVLDASAAHLAAPLHPVTIHVNFQPCLNYHVKQEPPEWRPN